MNAQSLRTALRRLMDVLYDACVIIAGIALVLISAVIPWAVYTRYVLNRAASWPEPMAVLLMIVLTFFGAAACYRVGLHMRVGFFVSLLPQLLRRALALLVEGLMALIALFMINWGIKAAAATGASRTCRRGVRVVGARFRKVETGFRTRSCARKHFEGTPWTSSSSSPPCSPAS